MTAGGAGFGLRNGAIGIPLLLGMLGHPVAGAPAASLGVRGLQERSDTIRLTPDFVLDGDLVEWRSLSADQIMAATPATPQTLVWVGQVPEGIVLAAELRGASPGVSSAGRFSVRLSDADPPVLPPIGWGHQFGFETLSEEAGCEGMDWGEEGRDFCLRWYRAQVAHRESLEPLFHRRWSVSPESPGAIREDLARPAFDGLQPDVRERLAPLEPEGSPVARSRPIAGAEAAIGLEILIPWEAFPPVRPLDLAAVVMGVGWISDSGTMLGDGDSARKRILASPRRYRLTACGYELRQIALFDRPEISARLPSEQAALLMIPARSLELDRLIVIDNEAAGYQYEPDSTALSPAAFEAGYSTIDLGEGESLCTPFLAYRHGAVVSETAVQTETGEGRPWELLVDSRALETRRLADGNWLVKQGPRVWWSYYGSGQCGACPRAGIDLFHIEATDARVTPALGIATVASGDGNDIEIDLSEDWLEVTVFRSTTDWEVEPPRTTWKETRYCFRDPANTSVSRGDRPRYEICGEREPVPEPPRRLRARYSGSYEP